MVKVINFLVTNTLLINYLPLIFCSMAVVE